MARLSLLFAVLAVSACADGAAPDPPSASLTPEVTASNDRRPGVRLDRLLASDSSALARLRTPRERSVQATAPGQTDSVVTWRYDGLTLETVAGGQANTGGRTAVRRVTITDAAYGTRDGLSVGETRRSIEAIFGEPGRPTAEGAEYRVGDSVVTVEYVAADGVESATSISWLMPTD